jgi:uncharacterized membrane protein
MLDGSNGWWMIFPIMGLIFLVLMVVFMVLMMSRMSGFRGRSSESGRGMGAMRMGPMGMMGGGQPDDDALEMLRRRYAARELTSEEYDAMRGKLQGRST